MSVLSGVAGQESRSSRSGRPMFYTILQKMSSVPMQRDVGDFRLLDKQCLNALRLMRESQRYTKGLFSWIGFEKKEVLFDNKVLILNQKELSYIDANHFTSNGIGQNGDYHKGASLQSRNITIRGYISASVDDLKKIINTIDRNAFMVINETKYVVNGFFK